MKPLQFIPFDWIDNEDQLAASVAEIKMDLKLCDLLSVDIEYHNLARVIHFNIITYSTLLLFA